MSTVDDEWDNLKSTTDLEEGFRREKVGVHCTYVHSADEIYVQFSL